MRARRTRGKRRILHKCIPRSDQSTIRCLIINTNLHGLLLHHSSEALLCSLQLCITTPTHQLNRIHNISQVRSLNLKLLNTANLKRRIHQMHTRRGLNLVCKMQAPSLFLNLSISHKLLHNRGWLLNRNINPPQVLQGQVIHPFLNLSTSLQLLLSQVSYLVLKLSIRLLQLSRNLLIRPVCSLPSNPHKLLTRNKSRYILINSISRPIRPERNLYKLSP
jgi:hypothetical protein